MHPEVLWQVLVEVIPIGMLARCISSSSASMNLISFADRVVVVIIIATIEVIQIRNA